MKDRILQIMKSANLSNADFAEKLGISTSSLSHIFSGRNNPSLDVVMRIHKAYPDINLNWLLYGEGEMSSMVNSGTSVSAQDKDESAGISGFGLFEIASENTENSSNESKVSEFRNMEASNHLNDNVKTVEKEVVRYIEKPQPKITEIRIYFDNGTYQVFKPEN